MKPEVIDSLSLERSCLFVVIAALCCWLLVCLVLLTTSQKIMGTDGREGTKNGLV